MSNPPSTSTSEIVGRSLDFAALFAAEDRHFWFQERNRILAAVVSRLTGQLFPGYRVLEVGCGTGNVLRVLEAVCRDGKVTGVDLFEEGLTFARRRCRCAVVRADIFAMPFTTPFDVVGLFDVLEHLPNDRAALAALYAAVAPGGALVLTVPAHQSLWSYTDDYADHYRRYTRGDLLPLLEQAGFRVEYCTQFMAALYPLLWLGRRLAALRNRRRSTPSGSHELFTRELQIRPFLNRVLAWLHHWESPLIARRWRLPLGTSLLAVARKPSLAATTPALGAA